METVNTDGTLGESFKLLPVPKDVSSSASDAGKTPASSGTNSKDNSSPFLQRQ